MPSPWASGYNPWTGVCSCLHHAGSTGSCTDPLRAAPAGAPGVLRGSAALWRIPTAAAERRLRPPCGTTAALAGPAAGTLGSDAPRYAAHRTYAEQLHWRGDWYMDTGATAHMFAHPGNLASFTLVTTDHRIIVGDGSLPITHVGHTSFPSNSMPITLSNILVPPHLIKNLIFVRRLTRENPITVEFDELGFCVKDARTRMVLHRCDSLDELYPVHPLSTSTTAPVALSVGVDLWHAHLGHPNSATLCHILKT